MVTAACERHLGAAARGRLIVCSPVMREEMGFLFIIIIVLLRNALAANITDRSLHV